VPPVDAAVEHGAAGLKRGQLGEHHLVELGLNLIDELQVSGNALFPQPPGLPFSHMHQLSGMALSLTEQLADSILGDPLCGLLLEAGQALCFGHGTVRFRSGFSQELTDSCFYVTQRAESHLGGVSSLDGFLAGFLGSLDLRRGFLPTAS
jgi:hypothetical protein